MTCRWGQGSGPLCRAGSGRGLASLDKQSKRAAPPKPPTRLSPRSVLVSHCRLTPSRIGPPGQPLTERPEPSGSGWRAKLRNKYILGLFSCFFFFLFVTSAFCFLSFRMFPNTSCLVRCLRQTERCRWRQCFIAQFVY